MHKNYRDLICGLGLLAVALGLILAMKQFSVLVDRPGTGDLATWFGGLMSALAFGGTIVLASQETRRRNRQTKALARIIIPGVLMKLSRAKPAFATASANLKKQVATKEFLVFVAQHIKTVAFWSAEDATALSHLESDCASQLMLIKEICEQVALALEFAPNDWNSVIAESIEHLDRAVVLTTACLIVCNKEYGSN